MSWSNIDKAKEGSGIFLNLKSGDSAEGVFVGEPYTFYKDFNDPQKREHESPVEGASFRFKINFATLENNSWSSKIFEGGITIGKLIRTMVMECGTDYLYKIKREGSTKDDTVWHVIPKRPLTQEEIEKVKSLKPIEMKKKEVTGHLDDIPF